jgi:cytidine deaminase
MSDSDDPLIDAASRAADNAYAPYSRFSVGAALRTRAGGVFIGCNVENAAYPVGTCAERGAIAAAVAIEGAGMEIAAIAIVARNDGRDAPCAPCGACRQAIAEFGGAAEVAYRGPDLQYRSRKIAALLPDGFTFAPADED